MEDLADWKNRRLLLQEYQKELLKQFPKEDYNVFVFGSFIRNDFHSERSDIDVVVYCEESDKQRAISDFSECFFTSKGIECDVLQYYYSEYATIFYVAIMTSLKMTDYFPKKLKDELFYLWKSFEREQREQMEKEKYLRWGTIIQRDKMDTRRR